MKTQTLPVTVNQVNSSIETWLNNQVILMDENGIRDFINEDSLAIGLMPELVKRHYVPTLQYDFMIHQWKFHITPERPSCHSRAVIMTGSTIAQAICLGILRLEKVKEDQVKGLLED